MKKIKNILAASSILGVAPALAFAQVEITSFGGGEGSDIVFGVVQTVINWAVGLLVIFAVLVIVWAAYIYLTGSASPERITKANRFLAYTAIALGVALLSEAIVDIVVTLVFDGANQGFFP